MSLPVHYFHHNDHDCHDRITSGLSQIKFSEIYGYVHAVDGGVVWVTGLKGMVVIGGVCFVKTDSGERLYGEVIGFEGDITKIMTVNAVGKVRNGLPVFFSQKEVVRPSNLWLGNIINAFGQIYTNNGLEDLPEGGAEYPLRGQPPLASQRRGMGERLETKSAIFDSFSSHLSWPANGNVCRVWCR